MPNLCGGLGKGRMFVKAKRPNGKPGARERRRRQEQRRATDFQDQLDSLLDIAKKSSPSGR